MVEKYNFVDGIPKSKLFVKTNPNISEVKRQFISNSLRNFFNLDYVSLVERRTFENSIGAVSAVFQILVYLVSVIALTITFFLLLVTTR